MKNEAKIDAMQRRTWWTIFEVHLICVIDDDSSSWAFHPFMSIAHTLFIRKDSNFKIVLKY